MLSRVSASSSAVMRRAAMPAPRGNAAALVGGAAAIRRHYHEKVLDHYENPRNIGTLPPSDPTVGTGLVGAPACGDVMKLSIRVNPETNRIEDVKFKTFGCGSAIASSSFVTEMVRGMRLEEAEGVKNIEIARELCLPPVKLHCSMLAEDAIKSAIKDYRRKRSKAEAEQG